MNKKIARIDKLVKFEKQMLNSIIQDVLSLENRRHRADREIDRLSQGIESSWLVPPGASDHISSRRTSLVLTDNLKNKIAELHEFKQGLQKQLDDAKKKLSEQKVRTKVLEELLKNRKAAHRATLEQEQIQELLDIASRKFMESQP